MTPRLLYRTDSHSRALEALRDGIRRREGIIVLTGDIGTGKTTVCRAAIAQLESDAFCAFISDPFVSREDLLKILLVEFGVVSTDELANGRLRGASRTDLSYPLYDFLQSLAPIQAYAVLVIDQAERLPIELLEEVRILSDFEGPEKLLQVVLVGQPQLEAKLKSKELRQLDQRVSVRCELEPLTDTEVGAYLDHRIRETSGGLARIAFSDDALHLVAEASGGVPRVVNAIADHALLRAAAAEAESIDADLVRGALLDLGCSTPTPETPASVDGETADDLSFENFDLNLTQDAIAEPITQPPIVSVRVAQPRWPRRLRRALALGVTLVLATGTC